MAIAALPGFWWFRDGQIAGLAQPGWNACPWTPDAFDLGAFGSWSGALRSERIAVADWLRYLDGYAELILANLYKSPAEVSQRLGRLRERDAFLSALDEWNAQAQLVRHVEWHGEGDAAHIELHLNEDRILEEAKVLHANGIEVLVNLTEYGPHPTVLDTPLDVHHFPIDDGTPPTRAQVEAVAALLDQALRAGRPFAAHCFAGIGRTSTMIVAALLLLGESLPELQKTLVERNPRYSFKSGQWAFVEELAAAEGRA